MVIGHESTASHLDALSVSTSSRRSTVQPTQGNAEATQLSLFGTILVCADLEVELQKLRGYELFGPTL
jgi:hypothetical protein